MYSGHFKISNDFKVKIFNVAVSASVHIHNVQTKSTQYYSMLDPAYKGRWLHMPANSYKYNHRREGIRVANARPKVIIFCKSRPVNIN